MTFDAWLLFCATELVLCFTPGPAVLLVVSLTATAGARAGWGGIGGILAANTAYFALSATGIGAVLLASWHLFFLVKWVGAAYLCWLGVRMLLARGEGDAPAAAAPTGTRPLLHGLVTQGANPKALMFFAALLPQFIDPAAPVTPQILLLGVSSLLIELVVLAIYLCLTLTVAQRARRASWTPALATSLHRAGGVLLLGAAAGLATLRKA